MIKGWMDEWYKAELDVILNEAIPHKWDSLIIIFGKEGSGKTTIGTQTAIYLDNKFSLKHCVFTPKQFDEAIETSEPESAILWDEAITGADVSLYATKVSTMIISKLTQIRKKKLKIILCFPYLYKLNKYFISRCMYSLYVSAKDFNDRGYCSFYNNEQTEFLYGIMKEKYKHNYRYALSQTKRSFWFKFSKAFYLNEKDYDIKKEQSRKAEDNNTSGRWQTLLKDMLNVLKSDYKITAKELSQKLNIPPHKLYYLGKIS